MCRNFKTVLYHGTVSKIEHVDVMQGRGRKDFGRGFYIATSKKQAIGMMHKKYREAIRRNPVKNKACYKERLYEVVLDEEVLKSLNVKCFETADIEWLDFVLMCREKGGLPHDYDLVIGFTADDDTALCLKAYWDGMYGKTGTEDAKKILLKNLEVENLGMQYFIGKQEVADKLISSITEIDWR